MDIKYIINAGMTLLAGPRDIRPDYTSEAVGSIDPTSAFSSMRFNSELRQCPPYSPVGDAVIFGRWYSRDLPPLFALCSSLRRRY